MTAADRLRQAADKLEQRATAATRGPWRMSDVEGIFYVVSPSHGPVTMDLDNPVCDYDREGVAIERTEDEGGRADGEWMALMNPTIAAPLAAWLRAEAEQEAAIAHLHHGEDDGRVPALAVADVILGDAS